MPVPNWYKICSNGLYMNLLNSPESYRVQKSLKTTATLRGVGLHSGIPCVVRVLPAPANHGIVFVRSDLPGRPQLLAHFDSVVCTRMATSLGHEDRPEVRISTVEHLMAALYALGISNGLVEVDGPEIPVLDGSAAPFVGAFLEAGLELQPFSTPTLKVLKPIKVFEEGAICELLPRNRLRLTTSIDFPHPSVGSQAYALEMTPEAFTKDVGAARTFGFLKDKDKLKAMNLALGASLENVLAFSDEGIANPEGARFPDECVRHKLLDAIGDLALCGCWIEGELVSYRGGHSIHLTLLKSLKDQRSHWEMYPAEPISHQPWLKQPSVRNFGRNLA